MFSVWRDFVSILGFLALLLLLVIGEIPNFNFQYWLIFALSLGISLLHKFIKIRYQKDFDGAAYLSSVLAVAAYSTLLSFSFDELIEFGFHLATNGEYFALKLLLSFWVIIWLPVVLDKLLLNRWFSK